LENTKEFEKMGQKTAEIPFWNAQVMNYIKSIHENEDAIQKQCEKVKELFQEEPGNWAVPNYHYIIMIMDEYRSARFLFSVGFYYLTIDCCRKIVESLVRFQQDIKPEAKMSFIDRIRFEMPWTPEDVKLAEEIYTVGCAAVHEHHSKIWNKSKVHSTLDEVSAARVLEEKTPEKLKHLIPSIKQSLHGTFGMEKFALEILNSTTELANRIIITNEHKKIIKTGIPKELLKRKENIGNGWKR
jgi:hypothetical protein